uniref:ATP synthase F0 subunit 8 n=1 Tax=Lysmata boggessi TaxID=497604 RepID=A0A8F5H633_9EUCA|nr:ATP synthase F0 subunit 8 [Lysmata boggessi]QVT15577.1 ATP synthase F0 subunit 8 [Lysmata boggessi]QXJ42669.1 ATP synthase F0 subunit 8 [Lysmata boggessi]
MPQMMPMDWLLLLLFFFTIFFINFIMTYYMKSPVKFNIKPSNMYNISSSNVLWKW